MHVAAEDLSKVVLDLELHSVFLRQDSGLLVSQSCSQPDHTLLLPKVVLMPPKTTREMATPTIGCFMTPLKVGITAQERLMYIDLLRFLRILLTNVWLKAFLLQEIMGDYLIIDHLVAF